MEHGEFYNSESILCDIVMVEGWHYAFVKTHGATTHRVKPNVNYGLWLVTMNLGSSVVPNIL